MTCRECGLTKRHLDTTKCLRTTSLLTRHISNKVSRLLNVVPQIGILLVGNVITTRLVYDTSMLIWRIVFCCSCGYSRLCLSNVTKSCRNGRDINPIHDTRILAMTAMRSRSCNERDHFNVIAYPRTFEHGLLTLTPMSYPFISTAIC